MFFSPCRRAEGHASSRPYPLLRPEFVRVFGETLGQCCELRRKPDPRGIDGAWYVVHVSKKIRRLFFAFVSMESTPAI
jgi:hypothetical protein